MTQYITQQNDAIDELRHKYGDRLQRMSELDKVLLVQSIGSHLLIKTLGTTTPGELLGSECDQVLAVDLRHEPKDSLLDLLGAIVAQLKNS
ncbi:hypothetical protein IQ268_30605 [Oculatella sp. LEGE 06141]|uniref:hypothetical protein n=1 Tax=Oculatella sp. LEGE 06141 TaxID=1828648 RepID=UPI00187E0A9A|nr:hypothetical protein [Oculatella sp. LEGE 06141]MBE9182890.1 hypothetical protein [Oculatella sp. LEGE 06141]